MGEPDERFKAFLSDRRFREIPKKFKKVQIDKRFQSMFTDERFKLDYVVDSRGKPIHQSSNDDLKRYYDLPSEDDEESEEEEEEDESSEDKDEGENVDDFDEKDNQHRARLNDKIRDRLEDLSVDYARGVGILDSESSSDEPSSDEEEEETIEHAWGELDKDAERSDEISRRLAVCNIDWDRVNAKDLMILFNSFLPPDGIIQSVTIYPSEFGKERLKEEELSGPKELIQEAKDLDEAEDKEDEKYHMEKLREYQIKRLKYYYAIVVFNTPEVANHIYTECDGIEYESSATKIDLRFVPDDVEFDEAEAKESCNSLPDLQKYKPALFQNTALQLGKVSLTWDETDPNRKALVDKIFSKKGKVDDQDLKVYLASSSDDDDDAIQQPEAPSSSEDDDDEGNNLKDKDRIAKYKALLASIHEEEERKANDVQMEVTWNLGLKDKAQQDIENKLKDDSKDDLTHFERMLEKRKQKKLLKKQAEQDKTDDDESSDDIPSDVDLNDPYFKDELDKRNSNSNTKKSKKKQQNQESEDESQAKAELELLLADNNDGDDGRQHFNLKTIQEREKLMGKKKKWKRMLKKKPELAVEETFKIDVQDDRFNALFTSHEYNIDPANPHFRKTKAMEQLIIEKQKRRRLEHEDQPNGSAKHQDLTTLVNSVKRKVKKS